MDIECSEHEVAKAPGDMAHATFDWHKLKSMTRDHCLLEKDVPPLFRAPFVRSGYRWMHQPWTFYLRSLFRLHNETLNVWTHLLGGVLIAHVLVKFHADFQSSAEPLDVGVVMLFGTMSIFMHAASAVAHLLHSRSVRFHLFTFCLDYVGVGAIGFGYNILGYCFCSHASYYEVLRPVVVPLSTLLAILVVASMSHHLITSQRQSSFTFRLLSLLPAATYIFIDAAPMVHKLFLSWFSEKVVDLQSHHLLHIGILGPCLLLYISHVPERWWPGRFDIFGCGHQWFHLGSTLVHYLVIRAAMIDLQQPGWKSLCSQWGSPLLSTLWWMAFVIIVPSVMVISVFVGRCKFKTKDDSCLHMVSNAET